MCILVEPIECTISSCYQYDKHSQQVNPEKTIFAGGEKFFKCCHVRVIKIECQRYDK